MSLFSVDVESDGPCPGLYSMVSFGAVRIDDGLHCSFFGKTRPISERFELDRLALLRVNREEHLKYPNPAKTMTDFAAWIAKNNKEGRPIFVSDNPAFDWQFVNYYLHAYASGNPFGHSARRIGDFYAGLRKDWFAQTKWHRLRVTEHTHNPVDDARGNAEALMAMCREFGVTLDKSGLSVDVDYDPADLAKELKALNNND